MGLMRELRCMADLGLVLVLILLALFPACAQMRVDLVCFPGHTLTMVAQQEVATH